MLRQVDNCQWPPASILNPGVIWSHGLNGVIMKNPKSKHKMGPTDGRLTPFEDPEIRERSSTASNCRSSKVTRCPDSQVIGLHLRQWMYCPIELNRRRFSLNSQNVSRLLTVNSVYTTKETDKYKTFSVTLIPELEVKVSCYLSFSVTICLWQILV